jgi:uncharacterized membrane protein
MYTRISTKKIALCGVLTALAMIFSYIESVIPVPIPVPGIKLGVANIAVITILYVLGVKEAIVINLLRMYIPLLPHFFLVMLTVFCSAYQVQRLVLRL